MIKLTKREWAHIIGVMHLDSMTGNNQSIDLFKKLTSAMIRPENTGEHNTLADEPNQIQPITIQPIFINKKPLRAIKL